MSSGHPSSTKLRNKALMCVPSQSASVRSITRPYRSSDRDLYLWPSFSPRICLRLAISLFSEMALMDASRQLRILPPQRKDAVQVSPDHRQT